MQWKEITPRLHGDIVIVDLSGKMCLCGEDEVPTVIWKLRRAGFLKFLLNLSDVPYLDSGGLGGLARSYTIVRRAGGALKFFNVAHRIRDLFDMTKLSSVFEVFDSETEALRSFGESV